MKLKPRRLHKRFLILTIIIIIHINNNDVLLDVIAVEWQKSSIRRVHTFVWTIFAMYCDWLFFGHYSNSYYRNDVFSVSNRPGPESAGVLSTYDYETRESVNARDYALFMCGTLSYVRACRTVFEGLIIMHYT